MMRDEVMNWIDSAAGSELMNPPEEVKRYLSRDRECTWYYELSRALARPAGEIDLYDRFLRASAEKNNVRPKRRASRRSRLLWSVPAGAAAALLFMFFVLNRFPARESQTALTAGAENSGALESVLAVATYLDEDVRSEDGALDYYYRLSDF
jgi:ferric-dicitrate binding protein FerR (iron transport regulator)